MNVQGYQKLTLLDYPGRTACTIFTGGCNLRCPFCHNASLVKHPLENKNLEQQVLEYLAERQGIIDGVCFTGGEPLLQPDLPMFVEKVKAHGLLVKLDTNGAMPDRLEKLLATGMVDYVAMDVKASQENYSHATGSDIDTDIIDKSIRIIQNSGVDHEFRTTLVKGIHTVDEPAKIAEWIGGGSKYFLQKFKDSGDILNDGCTGFTEAEYSEMLRKALQIIPETQMRG